MPKLDFRYLKDFISEEEFSEKVQKAEEAHRVLMTKSGAGNDFTGFVENNCAGTCCSLVEGKNIFFHYDENPLSFLFGKCYDEFVNLHHNYNIGRAVFP